MPAQKKTAKKTVRKTATKKAKSQAKKTAGKAKKAVAKKAAVKKVATKKKTAAVKPVSKKASPAKKSVKPKKTAAKKKPAKKSSKKGKSKDVLSTLEKIGSETTKAAAEKVSSAAEEVTRRVTEALRKRSGSKEDDDSSRKSQPTTFTLEDVREYLKNRKETTPEEEAPKAKAPASPAPAPAKKATDPAATPVRKKQSFGAASVADLLGFDPTADSGEDKASKSNEEEIPKKFLPYFRALVALHEEVYEGLHRHSEETLRRSNKEDSGDLSSYGQHMADAGTDSFDRDFALSMVSSEQEALYEIDEAIRRIREGSYGVCEITGKPISRDRLKAVPFTRYSVEGQMEVERGRKRKVQKAGIQGIDGDDAPVLSDDDSDD